MLRKLAVPAVSLATLGLLACGPRRPVDFSQGVPTKEQASVSVPTSSSQGLHAGPQGSATEQLIALGAAMNHATQGETSDMYRLTVGATYLVNGATGWLLAALAAGVAQKPASVEGNTAVYGPYTPYLSAITWKLTVTRTDFNVFTYILEGQDKTKPTGPWVQVISGSHTVTVDENDNAMRGFGQGTFLIEWDKASTLPGRSNDTGTCEVRYGKLDPKSPAFVDVSFNNVSGADPSQEFNAEYRFLLQPNHAGQFEFALDINMQPFTTTRLERWAIQSRWMDTGAGRSDVIARGGDLAAPVTVNECWDAAFISQFYVQSDLTNGYGVEAQACAFATADYSEL